MAVDITRPSEQDSISLQELSLYHDITEYRSSLGLAPIRLSKSLSTTAGRHVLDTRENIWAEGVELPEDANLHSWSDAYYYDDHRAPEAMWEAPARVGTDYPSAGYEISAAGFETTEDALQGWRDSPSHDVVLANRGAWEDVEFLAIGVGVDTSPGAGIYAGRIFHVWFGEALDGETPEIVGSDEADEILGTLFRDHVQGLDGDDEIVGARGDDEIRGGAGEDRLGGDSGDDRLNGGDDDDRLSGGAGDDALIGADGGDRISGGGGADRLAGGGGDDILTGGLDSDLLAGDRGADTFVYRDAEESGRGARRDVITDFERGVDRIDLAALDARSATDAHDPFEFIGKARFSERAGELRRDDGLIEADLDGDGGADFQIDLRPYLVFTEVDTDDDGDADAEIEVSLTPQPASGDFIL